MEPFDPIERNESRDHSDQRDADGDVMLLVSHPSGDPRCLLCDRWGHALLSESSNAPGGTDLRTRIGVALTVVALTLGGSLVASAPAGAAAVHAIAVNPSTGLSDGQIVTITGTGFDETPAVNDWSVAMCEPAALDIITLENAIQHCDITTTPFVFTHADAAGNLSTQYAVRKTFTVEGGRTVTCGQSPNDCVILVAQITTVGFTGAGVPISFGAPVKTVAECFRDFRLDHTHSLRYRFRQLLICVFTALTHRQPS